MAAFAWSDLRAALRRLHQLAGTGADGTRRITVDASAEQPILAVHRKDQLRPLHLPSHHLPLLQRMGTVPLESSFTEPVCRRLGHVGGGNRPVVSCRN